MISLNMEFGIGACGIIFGMKPVDVIKVLGMPDKINVCEDDDIYAQTYSYNKYMLLVWFERENELRVSLIQCFSPEMTVFGETVFLKEKKEVCAILEKNGITEHEDTDTPTEETLFYGDISAWFNFEFNRLEYVEIGAFLACEGGEELWPFDEKQS